MEKVILTKEALEKLKLDLEKLMVKRTMISEEIKSARSHGDLSENAEYHAAREAQSHNETEILKVKSLLDNYELVDTDSVIEGIITLNTIVEFKLDSSADNETVTIVSKVESDPMNNLISNESPIGSALIGHHVGEVVDCQTPDGLSKLAIIKVTRH